MRIVKYKREVTCIIILIVYAVFLFPACASITEDTGQNDIQKAYRIAVEDAANPEESEISNKLTPITDYNTDLVWDGVPGKSRVCVVTWTSYDGYDNKEGQAIAIKRDTWVTVVPELKDFINSHGLRMDTMTLRIEQLLGLPPKNGKTRFVELWVDPKDLFRPSPDPEIIDCEADLQFPNSRYMTVSPSHVEWINILRETSYGEKGYPWTQLGYTYDWGGDPDSDFGLSEFVIIKNSEVRVHAIILNEDYGKTGD